VVSIAVNAARNADGSLPESVGEVVRSLIGPNDFAAQSSNDEFLLIYSEDRGAAARRRLSAISQKLWDFQLRSTGEFQTVFSCGGIEVQVKSLEEAIASARQHLQQTKQNRKLLTMALPAEAGVELPLRKAV
jgi:GGDEF domain-containing protein